MAGLFSTSTIEQIRAASDIVEVIGSYLPLKRAGTNFVALCPFHKEKSPSFNVNPHRQIFHCFGCHKGGDVFRFVQDYESLPFADAVRRLAERAHIAIETEHDPAQQERRHIKDLLLQIHEGITQRWHTVLTNDPAGQIARDYLHKRGVPEEAIRLFRLGCAPDSWDDTVNWARHKGYDLRLVEQAGLVLRKEGTDHCYDRFRGRLIFPIADEQGRVIAFSGRVLSGDEKSAKYVNSPETPIFTKGRICYGLDKSRRALLDAGFAVICEGQLDLIACYLAGVQNIVAPQGTALTADHARLLRRYVSEVVLCFDSDTAGQKAAIRALDDLLASGLSIRVASVPAPHDPDSYIREFGSEAFRQLIQGARGFFDYYLDQLAQEQNLATDRGRVALVRAMGEAVHKTANAVLVDTYTQKVAHRLGVSIDSVRAEFAKASAAAARPAPERNPAPESAPATTATERPSVQEFWLLKLLLLDDGLLGWAGNHLELDWVRHPAVRRILEARLAMGLPGAEGGVATLLGQMDDPAAQSLITEAVAERREVPNRSQQLVDVTQRLRDQFIDRELGTLTRRLSDPALSEEEHRACLRRQQELRQQKKRLLPPAVP